MPQGLREIGSYRLSRELGRGGMGTVYEAVHVESGVRRALKVFTLDHGNREFLRKRFLAEARVLAKLDHPRLVKVRELAIETAGENPYFVMDLVLNPKGCPETLEDVRKAGGVTEELALGWYDDLRQALDCIHAHGVVHRDVKLENVLLDREGRAVLSDFGVSRIFDDRMRRELMLTTTFVTGETTGMRPVMGTYWYLAPELRHGGDATPASDWYALGVLMYRLLTGMWYEPNTKAFDLLQPFSKACQELVRRLLADDPARRAPIAAPKRKARPWWRVLAAAFAVAGLAGAIGGLWRPKTPMPFASASVEWNKPLALHCDGDIDFIFRPCPVGTNVLSSVSLVVTRPYWLGETPVTWRQWRAVRGGSGDADWPGRDEAPATYLTHEEAAAFCAELTRRFADRLPRGYEIRLPTIAEWRLAYQEGKTDPSRPTDDEAAARRARDRVGWFGQGVDGRWETAGMKRCFDGRNHVVPTVREVWPEFPPQEINRKGYAWIRRSSKFVPVPVRQKPANGLGLYDLCGNCFERCVDGVSTNGAHLAASEFGCEVGNPYSGLGTLLIDPIAAAGPLKAMLGSYLTPGLPCDAVWAAPFDRLPHLGFRLCIGPATTHNKP